MKTIEDLRKEIDCVDDELVDLYLKRISLCGEIGKIKATANKAVYDDAREKAVVFRLTENVDDCKKIYVKELYDVIFSTSRAYQSGVAGQKSDITEKIDEALKNGLNEFPVSATVACQGVKFAHSGDAAEKLFPITSVTYFKTFEGVFSAVENGLCDFGVLPIENSTAGSVSEVYDLMKKYRFSIVRSARIRIDHCVAVNKGAKKENVKTIVSHPQAIAQCSEYIKQNGFNTENAENTAVAAKRLSESKDLKTAVLCSEKCALSYGLDIIDRNVQDTDNNYTRFICISKEFEVYKGADKISVMTSLSHTPGSLNRILSRFSALGLNLTKIESRPIVNSQFDFMFYFDFEGDITDVKVKNLIAELDNGSDNFVFLGSYKEII